MESGFIVLLGIAVFAAIFYWIWKADVKRTEKLRQKAMMLGFQFYKDEKEKKIIPQLSFELFKKGHSKIKRNIMVKKIASRDNFIFEYSYVIGGGKSSSTHVQTVALIKLEKPIASFFLGPEGFFNKLAQKVGSQDIDFEYSPEFSDKYVLKGEDESAIRGLFSGTIVNYLAKKDKGLIIEAKNDYLLVYMANKKISLIDFDEFVEEVKNIGRMF